VTAILDSTLGPAVIGHLDAQLVSARRLLDLVLRQSQAIRAQDVEAVLARIGEIQGEMERRATLERDRARLLEQAGAALALPGHAVTLEALTSLMAPADARQASERSAELRGLLAEIAREHGINRALMRQELAFLDHLTRIMNPAQADTGYGPPAGGVTAPNMTQPSGAVLRMLDLQA
jgi:flagellar biosynthesis/type III secretory pathway chaperone